VPRRACRTDNAHCDLVDEPERVVVVKAVGIKRLDQSRLSRNLGSTTRTLARLKQATVLASAMRARYVWDYDISEQEFDALLAGRAVVGRLGRAWAAARLIDSAPYEEVVRRIGFGELVRHWPEWRSRVRSSSARRGLDFLVEWLPQHHPELLA